MFFQQEKITLDKFRSALKKFEELVTETQHSGTGVFVPERRVWGRKWGYDWMVLLWMMNS